MSLTIGVLSLLGTGYGMVQQEEQLDSEKERLYNEQLVAEQLRQEAILEEQRVKDETEAARVKRVKDLKEQGRESTFGPNPLSAPGQVGRKTLLGS